MAVGTSYSTASRNSPFTSTSCGMECSGSVKKINPCNRPSAIIAPSCASPPSGPDFNRVTGNPTASATRPPVVPVAHKSNVAKAVRCRAAQATISSFLSSCATSASASRAITSPHEKARTQRALQISAACRRLRLHHRHHHRPSRRSRKSFQHHCNPPPFLPFPPQTHQSLPDQTASWHLLTCPATAPC